MEAALEHLATREDGPFVARLPREPGKREQRYMHLFSGNVESLITAVEAIAPAAPDDLGERVAALEDEVAALKQRLESLLAHLGE
ncbi:G20.3 [Pluralibacter gergoviae]|nr:G20.3 [Pluralibacter gergoviae]